jgi:hypothetical protein
MLLRSRKYSTCAIALCATAGTTLMLLFAGIAAACEGPPGGCEDSPSVTTQSAAPVTSSTAWINGQVNPRGCVTTYYFEFKKTVGGSWSKGFVGSAGSSSFNQPVSEFQSGLSPETNYSFKLIADNSDGTSTGGTSSFTTPPVKPPPPTPPSVTTEAATGVTSTEATLNGFVNPNGLTTSYKFEYGTSELLLNKSTSLVNIGTGSQKVSAEVSLEPGTKYYFRIYASNSSGSNTGSKLNFTTSTSLWKIKSTPNPGASGNRLYDVSCEPSTSACTSVGKSTSSGADSPVALRWNGSTWSEQTAAKKSGATHTRLFGVDCPSETRCLAVGNHQSAEGPSLLSELWNEGKWNVQTTPLPAESTSSELVAIGCSSTANCTAVGSAAIGGVKTAVAEKWTSPNWALSMIPIPEGAKSSQLDGVDCIWSNFCAAVGRYTTSGGAVKSLVMFWNEGWTLHNVTDPVGAVQSTLLDVACTPTPNRCTAVGGWKNSAGEQFTLAYRFNGVSTWALQSTPNPTKSIASVLQEVSCPTETACTAAGSWVSSEGGSNRTLAEVWNGTTWSIQETLNPAGAVFSAFFGVSCRSTSCMGAGWSTNSAGVDSTLSEFRE